MTNALFNVLPRIKARGAISTIPLSIYSTTHEQMKMFLTRLGFDSKAVITGDITQIDLPGGKQSGLVEAARILKTIVGIGFCNFSDVDVVRHPLVQQIIRAYAKKDKRLEEKKGRPGGKKSYK